MGVDVKHKKYIKIQNKLCKSKKVGVCSIKN